MRRVFALLLAASLSAGLCGCQSIGCGSGGCAGDGLAGLSAAPSDCGGCTGDCGADCGSGGCGISGGLFAGGLLGRDGSNPGRRLINRAQRGCTGGFCGHAAGPTMGAVAYPYYTVRGPRDFLVDGPSTIGR